MRVRKVFAATTLTMVTFAPGWAEESAGGCLNKERRRYGRRMSGGEGT
jgi:hypothetical protein